ncbi:MAG: uracil phosphoribosyltransferase, partial [Akkermansiaceae bacterium]|nr:uracil phosphoribosyltransferase [Akkermansiaceae bacterium]
MTLVDHPLIADRVTRLRDVHTPSAQFRQLVRSIGQLMVPAVTEDFETAKSRIETPLEPIDGRRLAHPVVLVPILRAGLGMLDGFLDLLPEARVAHIGLARNEETLEPDTYYYNAPVELTSSEVLVLDPMLATGGTASETLRRLKKQGAQRLRFVCLVACPEGLRRLETDHPDVPVFAAAMDRELDAKGYI